MTLEEQETTIQISRAGEEALVWTSDRTMMTRLDRLCRKSGKYSLVDTGKSHGETVSKTYRVHDKRLVSFRADVVKRGMTDEQRAALSERMRAARKTHFAPDF